jgi:GDPmannose 4,6-dehydratase
MCGDASKAREKLGWQPKITFEELVKEMVQCDLETAAKDNLVYQHEYASHIYHE